MSYCSLVLRCSENINESVFLLLSGSTLLFIALVFVTVTETSNLRQPGYSGNLILFLLIHM